MSSVNAGGPAATRLHAPTPVTLVPAHARDIVTAVAEAVRQNPTVLLGSSTAAVLCVAVAGLVVDQVLRGSAPAAARRTPASVRRRPPTRPHSAPRGVAARSAGCPCDHRRASPAAGPTARATRLACCV